MCQYLRPVWRYQKSNQTRNSKNDRQYNGQKKKEQNNNQWSTKQYTENYRLSNRNSIKKQENTCAPEGQTVSAPLVASVVLLLFIKNIRW